MARVVIVGAGLYGLIAGKTYLQVTGAYDRTYQEEKEKCNIYAEDLPACFTSSNPSTQSQTALLIVDSAAALGGTWTVDRLYPNLVSQNSYGTFEYSDLPLNSILANETGEKNQFISGAQINQYFYGWSKKWELQKHMRFNWKVTGVSRLPSKEWKLEIEVTADSPSRSITVICDKLVLATGLTSVPHMPVITRADDSTARPTELHAKEVGAYCRDVLGYRPLNKDSQEPGTKPRQPLRSVVVYGGAKSSFDFVHLFASAHRHAGEFHLDHIPPEPVQVHWIIRDQGAGAAWIAPPVSKLHSGEVTTTDKTVSTRLSGIMNICAHPMAKQISLVRQADSWKWKFRAQGSWVYSLLRGNPLGRLLIEKDRKSAEQGLSAYAGYVSSPKMMLLRPTSGTIECTSAVGIANHADLWDTIQGPNVHIHRSNIAAYAGNESNATVQLADGTEIPSVDLVIHATGWKPVVPIDFHPPGLSLRLGLACALPDTSDSQVTSDNPSDILTEWDTSDQVAEQKMRKHLHHRHTDYDVAKQSYTPYRLFRRMVAPYLAAEGDRSFVALGVLLTNQIVMVAEVQALWAAAFLTGKLDHDPKHSSRAGSLSVRDCSLEDMQTSVSEDVAWGRLSGSNLFVDTLQYNDTLMRDLGLNPNRLGGDFWRELTAVYGPSAYTGIVEEWLAMQK